MSGLGPIAVTGGTGFVGKALMAELDRRGIAARPVDRTTLAAPDACIAALTGCRSVIHLAALAHDRQASLAEHMAANRDLTVALARHAVTASVRRLVFVSTIGVVAREGATHAFRPSDPVTAATPYAQAKAAAEASLLALMELEPVILRPPLVIGTGAKGNLARLERLARTGLPLPFGNIANRRDTVERQTLVDALIFLALAPTATVARRIFHVAEAQPVSTRELIARLRRQAGMAPRLFGVPEPLLRAVIGAVMGAHACQQLLGDLRVDRSDLLAAGWHPPARAEDARP